MKVILLEDVRSLGKKGEIVEVKDGYARNVLIAKKLGVEATGKNINDLKMKNRHAQKLAEKQLEDARALAADLAGKQVEVKIKTGEGGKVFGSVSTKEICAAAKDQLGLDLDKKKMSMKEPIKALGYHEVELKLHPSVAASLKVKVSEE